MIWLIPTATQCLTAATFVPASMMALMAMPHGYYFWSEFQSKHGAGGLPTSTSVQTFTQRAPDSANKIIEIVPGAVNYVGDWELRISSLASPRAMKLNRRIEFGKSTLEQYLAEYPEYANKYEIYVSKMGEKAISLNEPANQENEQPSDELAKPTKIHADEIVDTVVTTSPEVPARERSAPRIDLYKELLKLDDLRNKGLLTDAEFEAEKKKLLDRNQLVSGEH